MSLLYLLNIHINYRYYYELTTIYIINKQYNTKNHMIQSKGFWVLDIINYFCFR